MSLFDETGAYQEDLYYTHDALKNTTALFGIKAGRRALYEYGPYGNTLRQEGDAAELNPFRFSSEYFDEETGLVQYNYRYYNRTDGRWMSPEPLGERATLNIYQFISGSTTNLFDHLGLISAGSCAEWGAGDIRFSDYPPQIIPPMITPTPSKGNCYRYACNDPAKEGEEPYASPSPQIGEDFKCESIAQTILSKGATKATQGKCPKCYYKVNLVIRPHNGNQSSDYHWYRQDNKGTWSHKPGCTPVISGVISPFFDAKLRGYSQDCGIFCFPENGIDVDN